MRREYTFFILDHYFVADKYKLFKVLTQNGEYSTFSDLTIFDKVEVKRYHLYEATFDYSRSVPRIIHPSLLHLSNLNNLQAIVFDSVLELQKRLKPRLDRDSYNWLTYQVKKIDSDERVKFQDLLRYIWVYLYKDGIIGIDEEDSVFLNKELDKDVSFISKMERKINRSLHPYGTDLKQLVGFQLLKKILDN